jgi:hypothetical protein
MLKPKSYFFAIGKNEVIQIVEYELQRLRIALINFDDLADTASIEGFVFDVTEVAKNLLNFLLHVKSYEIYYGGEYLNDNQKNFES